jgi:hypothetical protein
MQLRVPTDVESGHAKAIYRGFPGDVSLDPASANIEIDNNGIAKAGIDEWAQD